MALNDSPSLRDPESTEPLLLRRRLHVCEQRQPCDATIGAYLRAFERKLDRFFHNEGRWTTVNVLPAVRDFFTRRIRGLHAVQTDQGRGPRFGSWRARVRGSRKGKSRAVWPAMGSTGGDAQTPSQTPVGTE